MRRVFSDALVRESVDIIRKEFRDRDSAAVVWVSDFLDEFGEMKERRLTDVFMNINEFLNTLDRIKPI